MSSALSCDPHDDADGDTWSVGPVRLRSRFLLGTAGYT
jgi:hypothetical protein